MKNFWLLLVTLFTILSCSRNSDSDPQPAMEEKIILKDVAVIDESTIKLEWTITGKNIYKNFEILKKDSEDGISKNIESVNGNTVVKIDNQVEFIPYIDYQIIGYTNDGRIIKSNIIAYKRPRIKLLNIRPTDVLFDKDNGIVFLFSEYGNIMRYDVNSISITKEISTGVKLGYPFLGTYNGQKELYVPRNDGWVYIYNPDDLSLIDKINFEKSVTSVILSNNKLFATIDITQQGSIGNYGNILKCIDRTTKKSGQSYEGRFYGRIKNIQNTKSSFFLITMNVSPTDLMRFNYDSGGALMTAYSDSYHDEHPLDVDIFEPFPSGNGLLTAEEGSIYDNNLKYIKDLPRGKSKLFSFDFDNNSIIAGTDHKTIEFYNINDYTKTNFINTQRYPFKVFSYGNKIVSVSAINPINSSLYYKRTAENVIIELLNK